MLAAGVLLVSCNGDDASGVVPSVRGVVVEITGQLDDIESFVLVDEDGARLTFTVTPESDFHQLPLSHLNEHRISGAPVVVDYEEQGDDLVVASLRDG